MTFWHCFPFSEVMNAIAQAQNTILQLLLLVSELQQVSDGLRKTPVTNW